MTPPKPTPETDDVGGFAARLTAARERVGMSQADLAQVTGMDPGAINHFERGRRVPSLRNAVTLARALDVPLDTLADSRSWVAARIETIEARLAALERKTAMLDTRTVGSAFFGGPRR